MTVPGQYAIRPTGELLIGVFSNELSDVAFAESLDATYEAASAMRNLSVGLNVSDFVLTARQRRMAADNVQRSVLGSLRRFAIVTDSALARSALNAIAWLVRDWRQASRPFSAADLDSALRWLAEIGAFDVAAARTAVAEARHAIGLLP